MGRHKRLLKLQQGLQLELSTLLALKMHPHRFQRDSENVNSPQLQISGNESISSQKSRSRLQRSDQILTSGPSAGYRPAIAHTMASVLSPAQADSPAASPPPRYVQQDATLGDKTTECNNTVLSETPIESNSSSGGASGKENSGSRLVAENHGRKDAPPLVDINGAAGVTVDTSLGRQITMEESKSSSEGASGKENSGSKLVAENHGRKDAPPLVDINGAAGATVDTSLGRQITMEEARVGSELPMAMDIVKDGVNYNTNDDPPAQSYSNGYTWIADLAANGSHPDEVQSELLDPALVSIHGYRVKEASAPILRKVIEKHGDIAMNCITESMEFRSYLLDKVCKVVLKLQTSKLLEITNIEVKKMLTDVIHVGELKVNVGWLQKSLVEILEALELVSLSSQYLELKKFIKKSEELEKLKEKIHVAQVMHTSLSLRFSEMEPKMKHLIEESLLPEL
ncbi:Phospholipase-like protein [Corchorus olitorius]|uniref:Phospholipase-like protein n=1 Tax=Corchorus olitorius TaxID=93759 RepID=A0A1R3IPL9_9ROSI|nr:Phospholipase-like protein [Corchorus olitorius]